MYVCIKHDLLVENVAIMSDDERYLRSQLEKAEARVAELEAALSQKHVSAFNTPSENIYLRALDNMVEGCQIIGFDWCYLYLNDAAVRAGRQPKDALVGHTMMEMYPGIENTDMFAVLQRSMSERIIQEIENEFTYPDGSKGWFELHIQPVPEGIFILTQDITERKTTEHQLKRYALRMEILHQIDRGLIEGGPIEALITSTLGHLRRIIPCKKATVVLIDDEAAELIIFAVDLSGQTALGKGVRTPIPPNFHVGYDARHLRVVGDFRQVPENPLFQQFVAEGALSGLNVLLMNEDVPVAVLGLLSATVNFFTPEYQEIASEVASQLAIAIRQMRLSETLTQNKIDLEQHVDQLETTQAQLQKSEAQYKLLTENMADVVWMLDIQTMQFKYVSPSVERLHGYTPEEIMAQPVQMFMNPAALTEMAARLPGRLKAFLAGEHESDVQINEVEQPSKNGPPVWVEIVTTLIADSQNNIQLVGVSRNIDQRRRQAQLQHRITEILEAIAGDYMLPQILEKLVLAVEERQSHMLGSVLLLDAQTNRLYRGAAPSLPEVYTAAIDGVEIGPQVGSCGTAAYEKHLVIVDDIQTNPLWVNFRDLAKEHDLAACWSQPIISHEDRVLGTFALYYDHVRKPTAAELELINMAAHIAGIAIQHTLDRERLRRNEARYRSVVEDQTDLICRYDTDFRLTFVNRAYAESFGMQPEAMVGVNILDRIPAEERNQAVQNVKSLSSTHPVSTTEHRSVMPDQTVRWFQWTDRALLDNDGNIVEYQGVGHDVTDRKKFQLEQERHIQDVENIKSFLQTTLDAFPANAAVLNGDGTIVNVNMPWRKFAEENGDYMHHFLGQNYLSICEHAVGPQSQEAVTAAQGIRTVISGQENDFYMEYPCRTPSEKLWFGMRVTPFPESTPRRVVVAHINITERKMVEAELQTAHVTLEERVKERTAQLQEAKERVEVILNHSLEGILLAQADLHIQQTNLAFNQLFACKMDDYFDQSLLNLIHPDDSTHVAEILEGMRADRQGKTIEIRANRQDASTFEAELSMSLTKQGGLVCTIRDISLRKERERQLRYHASIQESVSDAVIASDMELRIQSWNKAAELIYGWRTDEVIGKTSSEVLQSRFEDGQDTASMMQNFVNHGIWDGEVIQKHKAGHELNIRGSSSVIKDARGESLGIVRIYRDITESKKLDQALAAKAQEEREFQGFLKALHEISIELTQIDDLDSFYEHSIALGVEWLGFERLALFLYDAEMDEAVGTYGIDEHGQLHDEHGVRFKPSPTGVMKRAFQQSERFAYTESVKLQTGLEPTSVVGWNAAAALWNGNEKLGWITADNALWHKPASKPQLDILSLYAMTLGTLLARNRSNSELRSSEARYRLLAENITDVIAKVSSENKRTFITPSCYNLLGYRPDELLGGIAYEIVHPDDLPVVQAALEQASNSSANSITLTQRFRHKEGHYVWVEVVNNFVRDPQTGKTTEVIRVIRDISERKLAEESLQKSAAEIHDLYNHAPCGYHSLDVDGLIIQINDTELEWLGYSREEVVHKLRFTQIVTPESLLIMQVNFSAFKARGWISDIEFELVRKDGRTLPVLLNSTAVYDENGQYLRSRSTLFDMTELKKAQDALQKNETLLRTVLNSLPVGVWITDEKGTIIQGNPAAHQIWSGAKYVGPEDYDAYKGWWVNTGQRVEMEEWGSSRAIFNGETVLNQDIKIEAFDGAHKFILNSATPLRDESQNIFGSVIVNQDITARKQAEAALEANERQLRLLFSGVRDYAIYMLSHEGHILSWNPGAEIMTGYSTNEIIGHSFGVLYTPEDREQGEVERTMATALAEGHFAGEGWRQRKDGSRFWANVVMNTLRDDDGLVLGFTKVTVDMTVRKLAEEALRESEGRFRNLVQSAPVAIIITNVQGNVTLLNQQVESLFGYQPEELIGQPVEILVPEAHHDQHLEHRARYLKRPRVRQMALGTEITGRRKDGSEFPVEIELSYIETAEGLLVMSFIQDITVRKQVEIVLRDSLARERELNELKTRFVSMASHEFRTPLASILALTETLSAYRHKLKEDEIESKFGKIKEQVGHLKDIMEDVLLLARMQARRVDFHPVLLNFDSLCRSVLDEFQSRPDIQHQFTYTCDVALQVVYLDKKLMRQIISNLISNAVKYSPPNKSIVIEVTSQNRKLIFKISDQGIGIPEADVMHLFEPFHRAANVGTISGTGLGLVITKESVELHGGTIEVTSQVDSGTLFTITIPIPTEEAVT